jgi:hypothetical protein
MKTIKILKRSPHLHLRMLSQKRVGSKKTVKKAKGEKYLRVLKKVTHQIIIKLNQNGNA